MTTQQAYEAIRKYFTRPDAELAQIPEHLMSEQDMGSNCVYRKVIQGRVRKCAVGCLIPKRLYSPKMEQRAAVQVIEEFPEVKNLLDGVSLDFISCAQTCHDDSATVEQFVADLDELAHTHGLEVPTNA